MVQLQEAANTALNEDQDFVGTIAFRSEEISLPDGSSMALGIDGPHWVLVYQKEKGEQFHVYEYDNKTGAFRKDKKAGTHEEYQEMRGHVKYFFEHAHTEDLVTIMPPR
ncbi:MAG: hypothetical protein NT099_00730 [Candidatus Saganbacteria bacterium]|nr:hypothetical protein [Candidatus Saganbacteria bacterium]